MIFVGMQRTTYKTWRWKILLKTQFAHWDEEVDRRERFDSALERADSEASDAPYKGVRFYQKCRLSPGFIRASDETTVPT